jgi:hypothetical protein
MKQHLTACAFLIGCSGTLALGQQNVEKPWHTGPKGIRQDVEERSWYTVDKEWLTRQSKELLDIIEILYKGREAELKELEAAQAKMEAQNQIERRIALIKATLSEREPK